MQQIARKNKRNRKKLILQIFLFSAFIIFSVLSGIYLYVLKTKKPLYISPLAKNISIGSFIKADKNEEDLKKGLKDMHVEYENIKYTDGMYTVDLKNKAHILLSATKDIKSQLSSLQFILARLTMEGKLFTQLDLRFDKPVIRLK